MLGFMCRVLIFPALLMTAAAAPASAPRDRDTYTGGSQTFEVSGQIRLAETGESARSIPMRLERFSGGLVEQITTDNRFRQIGTDQL